VCEVGARRTLTEIALARRERYAHLLPDGLGESEFAMLSTDLAAGGEVVHMRCVTGPVAQMDRAAVS